MAGFFNLFAEFNELNHFVVSGLYLMLSGSRAWLFS